MPDDTTRGLTRRDFLGVAAAGALLASAPVAAAGRAPATSAERRTAMIRVEGNRVSVETSTLAAIFEQGALISLKSKGTGQELLDPQVRYEEPSLHLVYRGGDAVAVADKGRFGRVGSRRVSDRLAEVIYHGWDGDGVLRISADPETGDLLLEPSAYSSRPGVRACRWTLRGVPRACELVVPLFQGAKLKLDDPLLHDTLWRWPHMWEAGLAIVQGGRGGFWVHAEDTAYRYKALKVGTAEGAQGLGFDTEAYGPLEGNLAAGGLTWRINVYEGDWRVPAARYRDWLWKAYGLRDTARPEWLHELRLALSWCPTEPALLDALARRVPPGKVLLHVPNWRSDGYDENYPTYAASEAGRAFVAKAKQMGFRVAPHCNSVDMDPSHPVYQQIRDFQYRDPETKRLQGWSWHEGGVIGVPESNSARLEHRDKKVMIKVHPGLSMWRAILGEQIQQAVDGLDLDTVFIDVTLCSWNLDQCLVENMTSTEGMKHLIAHIGSLRPGLAVGGEGLNEITMQGLSFAQTHLFQSWQSSAEGLARAGGCALNEFLFGRLCRTIGYSGLSGDTEASRLRMRIHDEHGAIPTLTVRSAGAIEKPNAAVEEVLKRAGG